MDQNIFINLQNQYRWYMKYEWLPHYDKWPENYDKLAQKYDKWLQNYASMKQFILRLQAQRALSRH